MVQRYPLPPRRSRDQVEASYLSEAVAMRSPLRSVDKCRALHCSRARARRRTAPRIALDRVVAQMRAVVQQVGERLSAHLLHVGAAVSRPSAPGESVGHGLEVLRASLFRLSALLRL